MPTAQPVQILKARVVVGASHAYACINTPTSSMDVQLMGGMPASKSLQFSAAGLREKAQAYLARADVMDAAAAVIQAESAARQATAAHTPA
jgi:hypothetical protein